MAATADAAHGRDWQHPRHPVGLRITKLQAGSEQLQQQQVPPTVRRQQGGAGQLRLAAHGTGPAPVPALVAADHTGRGLQDWAGGPQGGSSSSATPLLALPGSSTAAEAARHAALAVLQVHEQVQQQLVKGEAEEAVDRAWQEMQQAEAQGENLQQARVRLLHACMQWQQQQQHAGGLGTPADGHLGGLGRGPAAGGVAGPLSQQPLGAPPFTEVVDLTGDSEEEEVPSDRHAGPAAAATAAAAAAGLVAPTADAKAAAATAGAMANVTHVSFAAGQLKIRFKMTCGITSRCTRQQASCTRWSLEALPGSALLRIFQLVCDSCPPEVPGTCWLAPVCSQWRDLACHVKGLRGVFWGFADERPVGSFCAWLSRHAPQVVALAISLWGSEDVLVVLAEVATRAAASGNPLPLQRLVVINGDWMQPSVYQDTLQPLLGALPHLQHLHLSLLVDCSKAGLKSEEVGEAVVSALAPLQHATSLTSLVLYGPSSKMELPEGAHAQILAHLPSSLRSLTWDLDNDGPQELVFRGLSALTHLKLSGTRDPIPANAFSALPKLRQLELQHVRVSDEGVVPYKQQLVVLGLLKPDHAPDGTPTPLWLAQLTKLTSLDVYNDLGSGPGTSEQLLQLAPGLKALQVGLPVERNPAMGEELRPWVVSSPWVLRHYPGLTGLQRLSLAVPDTSAAPQELCALTQLKQLKISGGFYIANYRTRPAKQTLSWAQAVAKLVNLELLSVPVILSACSAPWLTTLPRLVVLEVTYFHPNVVVAPAVSHISQLLAPAPSSSTEPRLHMNQVRVVCFSGKQMVYDPVAAAVPVLPPNRHLFKGSWQQLQQCGVELWPAPVAARLQQLV